MKTNTNHLQTHSLIITGRGINMKTLLIRIAMFLLLTSVILLNSCGDDGPTSPSTPDPTFSISTRNVTLSGSAEGIQFFFKSDMDVIMTKVNFTNPMGASKTYNLDNELFIADELAACQDGDVGYYKYGGDYEFTFVGKVNNVDKNFSVEKIVTVNSK